MSDLIQWEFGLAIIVVLASYLYYRHGQRVRCRRWHPDPAQWTGKAIDVTPLKPKLEQVRRDYLVARHPAPGVCFHRALLEWARHTVARLGYFQGKISEDHAHPRTS